MKNMELLGIELLRKHAHTKKCEYYSFGRTRLNKIILIVDKSAYFFKLLIASMLQSSCSKNNYLLKAQYTCYVVLEKANLIH